MDKKILCSISLGALNQSFSLPDGTVIKSYLVKLPESLYIASKENKIYKIHLFGPEDYVNGLINKIEEIETKEYSKKKIKFEVN